MGKPGFGRAFFSVHALDSMACIAMELANPLEALTTYQIFTRLSGDR
jgi:hypothetical protein